MQPLDPEHSWIYSLTDGWQFEVGRRPSREALLLRLRAFRDRLPADFKFDREEANGP